MTLGDKPEDIAADVVSRMLDKDMDMGQAFRAVGYGLLWTKTRGFGFDASLISKALKSDSKEDKKALEKALVDVINKAVLKGKKSSLEEIWGKTAFDMKASPRVLKMDIKMKNGDVLPKGALVDMAFPRGKYDQCLLAVKYVGPSGRDYHREPAVLSARRLESYVTGIKTPSISTLERWSNDAVALTPTGKRVEPDGVATDGSPSWLLVLGYI